MGRGFSIKTFVTQACVLIMSAAMALPVSARERRSCYEETVQPPVYQTLHEQVLVKAASVKVITHPPVYADRTRHVVLKPASVGYQTIAPVFRWQTRKVLAPCGGPLGVSASQGKAYSLRGSISGSLPKPEATGHGFPRKPRQGDLSASLRYSSRARSNPARLAGTGPAASCLQNRHPHGESPGCADRLASGQTEWLPQLGAGQNTGGDPGNMTGMAR